ncbi:hypothetical protein [Terasakiella sp. SH-1]|uniref:hypothetical protein n=1 Tax=Terasakiella sp. SH-1 TaxID=2560057 RepID=UPI001073BA42|nr:hypothetical protein [Terasakiella sp. SH-1]
MSSQGYETRVFEVLGLPDPARSNDADYHYVGDWEVADSPEAVDAVVERRLSRLHMLGLMARPLADEA